MHRVRHHLGFEAVPEIRAEAQPREGAVAAGCDDGGQTAGTAHFLHEHGFEVREVHKVHEGGHHVVEEIADGAIDLVINTPLGRESHLDDSEIRQAALKHGVPCITTLSGAMAAAEGIAALRAGELDRDALRALLEDVRDTRRAGR